MAMDTILLCKQLVSVGAKQSHIKLRNLNSHSDSKVINIKINKKHADTMNAMAEN